MRRVVCVVLALTVLLLGAVHVYAAGTDSVLAGGVCVNEALSDPGSGAGGFDTDGNGTVAALDEFVELYNLSETAVDISGWQLWDTGSDLWFTFPGDPDSGTTVLASHAYALVVMGVQAGGSLPVMANPASLAFNAGRGSGVLNNAGDNVVLYDPGADEYVHFVYGSAAVIDPTGGAAPEAKQTTASAPAGVAEFDGFSPTASRIGVVEDWGTSGSGVSLTRVPAGDAAVMPHSEATPGGPNASPTAISLQRFGVSKAGGLPVAPLAGVILLVGAWGVCRGRRR